MPQTLPHGEEVELEAKHDTTLLGHIFSADASSDKDMRTRKVVGLLNTYPPLTVIVFVINVKWFTDSETRREVLAG